MATKRIELTKKPMKITDGTEFAFVKVEKGNKFMMADSDSEPADLSQSQSISEISINPPFVIWVWTEFGTEISISKRTAR